MILFPNAKINIGLHVTARRPDGFHAIETLFYPIALCDVLEITCAPQFAITLFGQAIAGRVEDNLCVKAWQLLQEDFKLPPVVINLYKAIPSGAGLGGGSSDAAHTLLLLNKLFQLNLSPSQLTTCAARLGSDCPFFIYNSPQMAEGRGEQLTESPINLSNYFIVLLQPPVFVSTAAAYAGVTPQPPIQPLNKQLQRHPVREWKQHIQNDFEETIFKQHPVLPMLKQQLYDAGAVYAAMSGSGAAMFGLFENSERATTAAQQLPHVLFSGKMN